MKPASIRVGKLLVGSLALLLFGGCGVTDTNQLRACEEQLLEKLKSPSSYKRISAEEMTLDAGDPPHYHLVTIEYDASNSYGALIRDEERCSFRLDAKGKPTAEMFDPYEGVETAADILEAEADAAPPPTQPEPAAEDSTPDDDPELMADDVSAAAEDAERAADAALENAEAAIANAEAETTNSQD